MTEGGMDSEGGPSAAASTPESAELHKVLRRLTRDEDHRGTIRLVERWAEIGELPREARVGEARAFLHLRLMDRAWVRLKELTEADPEDQEALLLIARLYVERGWPARARRALDRLAALGCDAPEVAELVQAADKPAIEPPSDAREIERAGAPAQLLSLAEVFLATGSFLRARSLLERVRRANPTNARAELLLWGIQGDFVRRGENLAELLRELDPPPPPALDGEDGDWDTAERTDVGATDDGATDEGGVEAPTTELDVALEGREAAPFPSLFRRPPRDLMEEGEDEEPTVASMLARPDDMVENLADAGTDPGGDASVQGGDTQIMSILPGPGRGLGPVEGPIHRPREGEAPAPEPLDLRAWQQSMGMGAKDSQLPLEQSDPLSEDYLEDEDQDIVVMTRRESPEEPSPAPPREQRKPLEVVEKYPQPVAKPAPRPTPGPPPAAPVAAPEPPAFVDEDSLAAPSTDWTRLVVVVALTTIFLVGTGMMLFQGVQHFAADRVLDEVDGVCASGLPDPLIALRQRLLDEIAAGSPPRWARQVGAGKVSLALWELDGDESLRDEARSRLEQADGAPDSATAELAAALAFVSGDLERSRSLVARADMDRDGARALAARVALASEDPAGALLIWESRPLDADAPTLQLLQAEILAANDRMDEARVLRADLIERHGEEPQVFLAREEQSWESAEAAARLSALDRWLEAQGDLLLPRTRARAQVLRSDLLLRQEQVEQSAYAVALAIEADPGYAPALYRRAGWSAYNGEVRAALLDLERCLDGRPGDFDCRRGLIQLYLTEGQKMQAAEVVSESLNARGDGLLRAWIAAETGDAQRALDLAPEPAGEGRPLSWVVRARALGDLGSGDEERSRARTALSGSIDPFDRLLMFSLDDARLAPQ